MPGGTRIGPLVRRQRPAVQPERGAGEVHPVMLQGRGHGQPADVGSRPGPCLDEPLGRQDLQGVLGRGLPDAVPGDDPVP